MEDSLARGRFVYAGRELKIGPGWIPDYLMVSSDAGGRFTLTIIELEAAETVARKSARKYLPEPSSEVIKTFCDYLDSVIARCRQTADPRYSTLESLRQDLEKATSITVEAACALRSLPSLIEKHPLLDQPLQVEALERESDRPDPAVPLTGQPVLTRQQTRALYRAVLILDTVVRQKDHGAATLKAWLNGRTQPLKILVIQRTADFPELNSFFAANKNSGVRPAMEKLITELANLWSAATGSAVDPSMVRNLLQTYSSMATQIAMNEPMQHVFEEARSLVNQIQGNI